MMREFLLRRTVQSPPVATQQSLQSSPLDQLDVLCEGLSRVSTRDELDNIGSMLADFASIQLQTLGREPR